MEWAPKMSLLRAWLSLSLLLSFHLSGANLRVSVPRSPIQARPGSDVQLPCNITHTSMPFDLSRLAVVWKVGPKTIAQYEGGKFEPKRPGVIMDSEQLRMGDATLRIQRVEDTDTAIHSCFVIYMMDSETGNVDLRVEARPDITLGSTTVQLGKESGVRCAASRFYPGNISVTWFRNDVIVKGPESPTAQPDPHGLFNAESVLELTPQIADADDTITCRIDHRALDQPLSERSRLRVQAPPTLQILTKPPGMAFLAAKCLVSGFYPQEIKIQWLKNGMRQQKIESRPERMPDGTFSTGSVIFPWENETKASYVCQVQHEALDGPLEKAIHWQPTGEGVGVNCPTPPSCQDIGRQQISQTSCPTSVPGTSRLQDHWWLALIGVMLGLPVGAAVTIFCSKHKAKTKKGSVVLPTETEKTNDPLVSML
nr:tyrosine-protein phosphatase non-receptor type substrate 1-like isoform X1 [Pogona vitticeps]